MPLEMPLDETRAWLALLRAPGLGASGVRDLVGQHGGAAAAQASAAREARVGAEARTWLAAPDPAVIERDLEWLAAPEHRLVVATTGDFPGLLDDAANPPAALFVDGDVTCLWSAQIAIVGARSATASGLANARAFAKVFAQSGNTVTSGLAEGVDGAAHEGALEGGGKTVAVLGTGPDMVYPRQHRDLAQRIAQSGALVSEFPPGSPGRPENFPRRNRIIAGLSLGTLVVEASLNSGSLITARLANEAGREVFALPGSIHSPLSRGCHKLIRDGAKLVETAEEVLEELRGVGGLLAEGLRRRLDAPALPAPVLPEAATRDADYQRLLAALGNESAAVDELVERTQLSVATVSSMLLVLELDGDVTSENGRYARR